MSQTAITLAFEQWKAQQAATGEPVLLDEFVFALVPGLDPDLPVDRSETLPPAAQIVHREPVTRKGVVNENAVVHSAVLGADVGDFSFNWIGLTNKATGTLAMIVHAPEQQKLKTKEGQQGNVLTRSFLMEFTGAQTETAINTPAETWQIDFTARMAGMDERQRLENTDLYGTAAFFGDGWLVGKTGNQFFVTKGAGYVAGLRAVLAANQNITVTTKPVKIWLDVCWTGALTSVWAVQSKVTVAANLSDYEQNGVKHYVFALASIDANGNITDLRPKGTLGEQQANSDFVRKDKNLSDINDKAKSLSNIGGVPKTTEINGYQLSDDIDLSFNDVGAMPVEVNGVIRDGATMAAANKGGWWRVVVTNPAAMSDFPARPNGTKLYGYGYMFVMLSENSWLQHYYSHRGEVAIRQEWTTGPTTDVEWNIDYNPANKPTAGDVGALPVSGGEVQGPVTVKRNNAAITIKNASPNLSLYMLGVDENGGNLFYVGRGGAGYAVALYNYKGSNGINLNEDGSILISLPAGKNVTTNRQFVPLDYGNFDLRYQAKGNYTPSGEAYTKAQSDSRYLQGIRVSATQVREFRDGGGYSSNDAAFATAIAMVGGSSNVGSLLVRYLQRNINGTWVNVAT
ncbi:phage tail protein [Citrobacter sp. TBCP-5362]|uniref:phage tail protein n=1 Tax=Citrobacter TaxID=544 RepID=UPI000E0BD4DF|nr:MULTISPECIES: phage tail protein [Citrobacter]QCQ71968.1 phage tail protein [Citrobacter sp. TBCP-5362]WQD96147.1 phage tail protein [Citrobacter koseri]SUX86333.1 Tail fiber protein [Citrobacter koseri]